MQKSETIGELSKALGKAESEFPQIKRSQKVNFATAGGTRIKYSYAPLSEIFDAIRKPLAENGLAISQPMTIIDGKLIVETVLSHSSGEWISGQILIESQKLDPQSIGSALTYARRYSLSALLGIASEEDDDAEGAMNREQSESKGESKPESKPESKGENICPIHGVPFRKFTKGNQEWWSHKTEEGWCNKNKVLEEKAPLIPLVDEVDEEWRAIPEFKNVGDFFMHAFKRWKLPKSKVMKLLELTSVEELKDLAGAWVALTELIKEA